jgi:uncharacterized protein YndB with AHSA1/START domain
MASYYTSQGYDAPASYIWPILTDFSSWPEWFPNVSAVEVSGGLGSGTRLVAQGDQKRVWTEWQITDWDAPHRLVCEHIESSASMSDQVQAAYLQFELVDEPEGCTLEVEIGAEGHGIVGDFFVGMTLGTEVRRMLPRLIDAFSDHVIARSAPSQ